jgi:D-alanine-D-alanine ligase
MRIGLCFNLKHQESSGYSSELDFDTPKTIDLIVSGIENLGHTVRRIEVDTDIFQHLHDEKSQIDLVFNIAEGLWGDARESWVPLACEMLKIPYTHSTPSVLALCLDKNLTKLAVSGLGFATPHSVTNLLDQPVPTNLTYPIIIKPNAEGSSVGVFNANVVYDSVSLVTQLQKLRQNGLTGELLLEEYIEGREFTVGILGNNPPQVLPVVERNFDILPPNTPKIAGYELKWLIEESLSDISKAFTCPAVLTPALQTVVTTTSLTIYQALAIQACARIDYRLDANGTLYFLEINPLPGLNPDQTTISYFPVACRAAGLRFSQVADQIIRQACSRFHL